jgi:hypothetical protein
MRDTHSTCFAMLLDTLKLPTNVLNIYHRAQKANLLLSLLSWHNTLCIFSLPLQQLICVFQVVTHILPKATHHFTFVAYYQCIYTKYATTSTTTNLLLIPKCHYSTFILHHPLNSTTITLIHNFHDITLIHHNQFAIPQLQPSFTIPH